MNKTLALSLLALVACGDSGSATTGDTAVSTTTTTDTDTGGTTTGPYTGPTMLTLVQAGCESDGATWFYHAETMGWTSSALANAYETGNSNGWNEEHTIPSIEADPNMWFDILDRTLTDEASVASFTPDVSTVFACGVHDVDPVMTYAVRVYDLDGNLADCAIWGDDTAGVMAAPYPDLNPTTAPDELGSCVVWTGSTM